jgi:hypothetical protein
MLARLRDPELIKRFAERRPQVHHFALADLEPEHWLHTQLALYRRLGFERVICFGAYKLSRVRECEGLSEH